MRLSFPKYRRIVALSISLVVLVWLPGCGETPVKDTTEPVQRPDTPVATTDRIFELPQSQFSAQFYRAEQQLLAFDWMAAIETLATIPPEEITVTDDQYLNYLQARIAYARGDQQATNAFIAQLAQPGIDPAIGNKSYNFQRHMLSMSGQYVESARLGDNLLKQFSPNQPSARALRESIWQDLQHVSAEELQLALDTTDNPRWRGWLSLALVSADAGGTSGFRQALSNWVFNNPDHPANENLPGGQSYLLEPSIAPGKIVLMLPLSGRLAPAAKAVRDGYMANYYASAASTGGDHDLEVLDLDRHPSALQAYDEAVTRGANLVIGPLSKQDVAAIGSHPTRSVPVLALNRVDSDFPVGDTALIQLSLSPEDEAQQIASLAFGQGGRRALIIRPAGSWGTKMEQALSQRWIGIGGTIGGVASYSSQEDYSSSTATALNLSASEQRAKDVRSMLATNIEFTPRRRQDLDVIFLLARNAGDARSLKPLLAYHYAADLPVYGTTSIYRGMHDGRDKDLRGVQLVETPWLLGASPQLRAALKDGGGENSGYNRLYALGADAWLLQSRYQQLQSGPDVRIRGNTGLLSLDPQLRIQRELQPAVFDGSVLVAR
jgi:outer membrane PBP1 activator LpoA protein